MNSSARNAFLDWGARNFPSPAGKRHQTSKLEGAPTPSVMVKEIVNVDNLFEFPRGDDNLFELPRGDEVLQIAAGSEVEKKSTKSKKKRGKASAPNDKVEEPLKSSNASQKRSKAPVDAGIQEIEEYEDEEEEEDKAVKPRQRKKRSSRKYIEEELDELDELAWAKADEADAPKATRVRGKDKRKDDHPPEESSSKGHAATKSEGKPTGS